MMIGLPSDAGPTLLLSLLDRPLTRLYHQPLPRQLLGKTMHRPGTGTVKMRGLKVKSSPVSGNKEWKVKTSRLTARRKKRRRVLKKKKLSRCGPSAFTLFIHHNDHLINHLQTTRHSWNTCPQR
jgi:hypothetical protein